MTTAKMPQQFVDYCATAAPKRTMKEIRLEWRIAGRVGAGMWRPSSVENKRNLTAWADAMCRQYGLRTHWIVERNA
jgi:hypothetical protein